MVDVCKYNNLKVLHLMGGAPALYIDKWYDIIDRLTNDTVFHSDLLLVEGYYKQSTLRAINKSIAYTL